MCDPLTATVVIGTALSVASAGATYIGQNEAHAQATQNANLNYANKRDTISAQANQLDQQKSENAFDTALTSIQSEGTIAANASEQGLAPTSIAHSINASMFGIGRNATVEEKNDQNQRLQLGTNLQGAAIQRQSDIAKTPGGSLITLGIGTGKALVGGYGDYTKATK